MTEGSPFRSVVAGLTGAAVGAGSIGGVMEIAGNLRSEVQVALLVVVGVIVVVAEAGIVLLASQHLRLRSRLAELEAMPQGNFRQRNSKRSMAQLLGDGPPGD